MASIRLLRQSSIWFHFVAAVVFISLVPFTRAKDCYYPDGSVASKYSPCDESADNSPCCAQSDNVACLSSGLCYGQYGYVYRGACTDSSWEASECPDPCSDRAGFLNGGMNILACNDATGYWCCADGAETPCCQDSSKNDEQFYLNPGTVTYVGTGLSSVATDTVTNTVTDTVTETAAGADADTVTVTKTETADAPDADTITVTKTITDEVSGAAPDADTVTVTTTATAAVDTITATVTTTAAAATITSTITAITTAIPAPAGTATIIVATGSGVTSMLTACATAAEAAATVSPDSNHLSTGATAGIAVGIAVPVLLTVVFAALWLVERYKRKHLEAAGMTAQESGYRLPPPAPPAPPQLPVAFAPGQYGSPNGALGAGYAPMMTPRQPQPPAPSVVDNSQTTAPPHPVELSAQTVKPPDYYTDT
ncbi:hypothetical protein TWF696_000344 [Orbilia brochopaga]|uniref:Mid2 domain-containing protein n=1 Tax=Orbilia brochopaga TaxID=3140254 RepID=A0AAV9VDC2_9PEZI